MGRLGDPPPRPESLISNIYRGKAVALGKARTSCFVATTRPADARAFYEGTLGLRFRADDEFAQLFDMPDGVTLRIQKVRELTAQPFTVLGWEVTQIRSVVRELRAKGVVFVEVPGLGQDADSIWTAPDGTLVAWFRDPDKNIVSLSEHRSLSPP